MGWPLLQQVQDERMGGGYRDTHKKAARPRNRGKGGKWGFPNRQRPVAPPYFRLRRMTFLQVAVQVRLCRALLLQ